MPRRIRAAVVAALGLVGAGCAGAIGGAPSAGGGASEPPRGSGGSSPAAAAGAGGGSGAACASRPPAAVPLHRLTAFEYDATVADLLGDDTHPARAWPDAASSTGFDNSSGDQAFSTPVIKATTDSAADVAARAAQRLATLVPCDPAKGDDACAAAFVERFGKRAFRRPLLDEDRKRLRDAYLAGSAAGGFALGIQTVIESALLSPHFLYRVEGAATPEATALTSHEIAARVSYFLTGSMPDDALAADADAGKLADATTLAAHARRLIASPRGAATVARFHRQWLLLDRMIGVTRDAKLFPAFTDRTAQALVDGAESFASWIMADAPNRSFRALLTSDVAFVSADSAWVLGAKSTGSTLAKITSSAGERAGIVTLPAILGGLGGKPTASAPVLRGKFVREQLLCQGVPPPPANLDVRIPDPMPGQTTRQRFAAHSTSDACVSCHRLLDGVGFGFEAYDAVGAHRATDQGQPVDDSGTVVGTDTLDGPFHGAVDLAAKLASSAEARACVVRMWLRFALTRLEAPSDDCLVAELASKLARDDFALAELPVALVTSAAFSTRAPATLTSCQP